MGYLVKVTRIESCWHTIFCRERFTRVNYSPLENRESKKLTRVNYAPENRESERLRQVSYASPENRESERLTELIRHLKIGSRRETCVRAMNI